MRAQSQSLLLLLALATLACSGGISALVGGWQSIENPNDPQVQAIAKFAVAEHNKSSPKGKPLLFLQVVAGETQVVAGTNYRLVIRARSGGGVHSYEAVVWDKPWENFRKLTSFKLKG